MSEDNNNEETLGSPEGSSESTQTDSGVDRKKNFDVTRAIREEENTKDRFDGRLDLPMEDQDTFLKATEHAKSLKLADNEDTKTWRESLEQSRFALHNNNALKQCVSDEDAMWKQGVDYDETSIYAGRPKIGVSSGERLTGEAALLRTTSLLQIGSVLQVPLWHTGIWITLKSPSEAACLELERKLSDNKLMLGRSSGGMLFSNASALITRDLAKFILEHVFETTLKNFTVDKLLDTILTTDYPQMIWGIINTIYPKGYPLSQPCTAKVGECSHVVKEHINLGRISWTNQSRMTPYQLKHMYNRIRKVDEEDLKKYQSEGSVIEFPEQKISDNLYIDIKTPTLRQYISSGEKWIGDVQKIINDSLGSSVKGAERQKAIGHQATTMGLRRYSHWISKITITDNESDFNYIDDRDTIDDVLDGLVGSPDITKSIKRTVGKCINAATMCLIGIPNYECPACGGDQTDSETNIIPLDIEQIFFTLNLQRMYRLLVEQEE
jgi:hypothetical protein